MIREIKVSNYWFVVLMRPCHFFLHHEGVLEIGHLVVTLFHQSITFCNKCTLAEVHVKWSVILMDFLGPDIFSTFWMKRQVSHLERAYLKVPVGHRFKMNFWLKSCLFFLSRLNEIGGGCEKIVLDSELFRSNLKFLRTIGLTTWLWG